MPKKLANWNFKDIETFLKKKGFTLNYTNGSHYYYRGTTGGQVRNVCLPFHGNKIAIKTRTVKSIILQSGVPIDEWMQ